METELLYATSCATPLAALEARTCTERDQHMHMRILKRLQRAWCVESNTGGST